MKHVTRQVVETFNHEQRRALLRFATSCSRPPLLYVEKNVALGFDRRQTNLLNSGFKELNPLFAIRDSGSDQNRLPTSSTCVNLLKVRYLNSVVCNECSDVIFLVTKIYERCGSSYKAFTGNYVWCWVRFIITEPNTFYLPRAAQLSCVVLRSEQ